MDHDCCQEKLIFSSRLDEVSRVEKLVLAAVEAFGYTASDRFAIKLALEEALANAIKHGNRSDPEKHVTLEFCVDQQKALITVCDEGKGFDLGSVPDPTLMENLDKPYGRGVMLMNAYMNEVHFSPEGNRVTLVKVRTPPDVPEAK